jgi:hypothetical protein
MLKAVSIPDMTMSTKINTTRQDRVKTALDSLRVARILQRDRQIYGTARVNRYVEDVDGDWLEKWGEDKEDNHYSISRVIATVIAASRSNKSHSISPVLWLQLLAG